MKIKPRRTRQIKIGSVYIGAGNPISIQSMTKTFTKEISATLSQIKRLEKVGCEIVRLAIKDYQDAAAIRRIRSFSRLPLVGDIHFDWRLAIAAIENGIDKIRLNPGNIYKARYLKNIIEQGIYTTPKKNFWSGCLLLFCSFSLPSFHSFF